jgi:hypothetical protein
MTFLETKEGGEALLKGLFFFHPSDGTPTSRETVSQCVGCGTRERDRTNRARNSRGPIAKPKLLRLQDAVESCGRIFSRFQIALAPIPSTQVVPVCA